VGNEEAAPPKDHDAAIVFAPAGDLVPFALRATRSGGTVVVAGIHLSEIPALDYASTLFGERDLRSVTANTRQDGVEFLRLVRNLGIAPRVTAYPFGEADRALDDLRGGRVSGSVTLVMG
jgi:propanol-preferring alcohol dehydrogenase